MCGIFGVIKAGDSSDEYSRAIATLGFMYLGHRAMERGVNASGIAAFIGRQHFVPATQPDVATLINCPDFKLDGWLISRRGYRFSKLWRSYRYQKQANKAAILMGHTRLATIGNKAALVNASPLIAGNLIGTHNGGVARRRLQELYELPPPLGETSSELIFTALDRVTNNLLPHKQPHVKKQARTVPFGEYYQGKAANIVEVLRQVQGRAALAWADRNEPGVIYLARTALSPLAVARDKLGNFYWASNYHWFSDLDAQVGDGGCFGFSQIQRVREGTVLIVKKDVTSPNLANRVKVVATERFQSYARQQDWRLSSRSLWYGFSENDAEWELANAVHKVI